MRAMDVKPAPQPAAYLARPVTARRGALAETVLAALAVAILLLAGSVASLLLRLATILLPLSVVAGLIAFAAFRVQVGASYGATRAG
jgi:hypothetical protein